LVIRANLRFLPNSSFASHPTLDVTQTATDKINQSINQSVTQIQTWKFFKKNKKEHFYICAGFFLVGMKAQ
jgi:uncharacterized protein YfaQ (DUF2300 family)